MGSAVKHYVFLFCHIFSSSASSSSSSSSSSTSFSTSRRCTRRLGPLFLFLRRCPVRGDSPRFCLRRRGLPNIARKARAGRHFGPVKRRGRSHSRHDDSGIRGASALHRHQHGQSERIGKHRRRGQQQRNWRVENWQRTTHTIHPAAGSNAGSEGLTPDVHKVQSAAGPARPAGEDYTTNRQGRGKTTRSSATDAETKDPILALFRPLLQVPSTPAALLPQTFVARRREYGQKNGTRRSGQRLGARPSECGGGACQICDILLDARLRFGSYILPPAHPQSAPAGGS